MTDTFDELIDEVVNAELCATDEHEWRDKMITDAKTRRDTARTSLRAAIDEVVKERETLAAQLAEANADAERLANQWVVFGQKCCSYCGAPVRWNIDDSNPIAKHAPDCPIELHRARLVGKEQG